MTVLVTGATGFLGPYLLAEFIKNDTRAIGVSRSGSDYECDLMRADHVHSLMAKTNPDVIIHAAAMTDVNKCQSNPDEAIKQNAGMTKIIVSLMPPGCRLIYISTDMVYSGTGPHKENSKSENPINMYGMSKFMGEFEAAKASKHLILRTNMYGFSRSKNKTSSLVDFLVDSFRGGGEVKLFTDMMFSPLAVGTLAKYVAVLSRVNRNGTFNLGATNGMSKSKFALLLAKNLGLPLLGARPLESNHLPGRAPRPLDTRLDITRIEAVFGLTLPNMEQDLDSMCRAYLCVN